MNKYDYLHELYLQLSDMDALERNSIMEDIEQRFDDASKNGYTPDDVMHNLGSPKQYGEQLLQNRPINVNSLEVPSQKVTLETTPVESYLHKTIDIDMKSVPKRPVVKPTHYPKPKQETPQKIYTSPQTPPIKGSPNHPVLMVLISFGMLLFNSIFVLAPFITLWALGITFIAVGFTLAVTGFAVILSGLFSIPMGFVSVPIIIMTHPVLLFCFGFLILGIGGMLSIAMIYFIRFCAMLTAKYCSWNIRLIRGY